MLIVDNKTYCSVVLLCVLCFLELLTNFMAAILRGGDCKWCAFRNFWGAIGGSPEEYIVALVAPVAGSCSLVCAERPLLRSRRLRPIPWLRTD